ncbi:proprotein convertase subtilisin/kexin type 5-like [Polymixia lowei]
MDRQCHLCHHTCQECNDEGPDNCTSCDKADRCLHCDPGHNLRDGSCVPLQCGKGEVAEPEYEDCLPCDEGCNKCQHSAAVRISLSAHADRASVYPLYDDCTDIGCGECVEHCVKGFFVDEEGQDCEPCHRACHTCGGPKYDDCDSCEKGFTLKGGECLDDQQSASCPDKHFVNHEGECEQCHPSCKTCFMAEKENCLTCQSGRFLTARQSCLSSCPLGTFANRTSGQCEDCLPGCVVCKDAQRCQRCDSWHTKHYLQDGVCVVECQRGFPQHGACQPCAPECASCRGNASHCLSCASQYLLLGHACKGHCPEGHYATETECLLCPPDCKECNRDGLCHECAEYFFLHKDKCVDDCPAGYFASEGQQECVSCHADCTSCDGPDSDDCSVCRNPKAVRYNGECLPECPSNTYHDKATSECRDCDRSCLTCSGPEPSSCLTCSSNMRRDGSGHCAWYSRCSLSSYMGEDGECQLCHPRCHRCSGPGKDRCLSCNAPHFLLNDTCVEDCPVGYYGNRDELACERCHFSCESCTGRHSVQCVACKPGFFRQGHSCVETCSESHFGNSTAGVCERCDPSCGQCLGRGRGDCLSCREGYLYLRQRGQCLRDCPPHFYQDNLSKTCRKCHPSCKTCRDEGALACQSCYEGYNLFGGICESQCLLGFYAASQGSDSKNSEPNCAMCDSTCLDCRGPSKWDCMVCPALQILSDDGRCLSCCGNEPQGSPVPWRCCDCEVSRVECILGVNFLLRGPEDLEASGSPAKVFVTTCILLIIAVGAAVFLFLHVRSKSLPVIGAVKTKPGGYMKLDSNEGIGSQPATSSLGDYSDRVECEDDEEEDEEDNIIYMGQDGTVYRKFKYGLLDEDEEIELEYDDESYSFK